MRIELVESYAVLSERSGIWEDLLGSAQGGLDVFQSPAWLLPWWRHLGREQGRIHCLFAWEGQQLVAIAPLAVVAVGGARVLRFMGDPLNDYNRFVLRRGAEASAGKAILRFLATGAAAWDSVALDCLLHPADALGTDDGEIRSGFATVPLSPPPTVLLSLPADWDTYRLGPVTGRRTLERKERKLRREAAATFRVCCDGASAAPIVSELERLRLANWEAFGFRDTRDSLLFGESFSAFLREAGPLLADGGRLQVGVIEGEEGLLAAGLYLSGGGVLMKYMQGWDHSDPSASVGLILDWLMIRHAIESGFDCFDFGRGDETYKFRLGGASHDLAGFQLFPRSVRGRLAWSRAAALHSARGIKRRLGRWRIGEAVKPDGHAA